VVTMIIRASELVLKRVQYLHAIPMNILIYPTGLSIHIVLALSNFSIE